MRPFTVAVAALIALGASAPAQAVDTAAFAPKRGFFLTVSEADNTRVRGVLLRCDPKPAGRHPHAASACAEIARASGDLGALPRTPRPCTKKYDPVTVSATGTHRGRGISWVKDFPNRCEMEVATGSVFRF
ncbi:SSI family serine proteinase inhibitor [Streptomyces sp. DSM 118878]